VGLSSGGILVSAASAEVALHGITHRIELHADFFDAMGFREGPRGMMQTHLLQRKIQ
jgi:hypothetical protein